jgi:hypothetical protein
MAWHGRYEVKEPEGAERGDEGVWRARTAQAQAQLEHQEVRALNLELLQRYGKGAWLTHCDELERIRKALQQRLDAVEAEKQALNAARAAEQTDGGARIRDLETQLAMVIARDFELQMALRRLQAEVAIIRQQATDRHVYTWRQWAWLYSPYVLVGGLVFIAVVDLAAARCRPTLAPSLPQPCRRCNVNVRDTINTAPPATSPSQQ